jgi:hypothetical protein
MENQKIYFEIKGEKGIMVDIDNNHKIPFEKCVRSVSSALAELLKGLVLAGFSFSCYKTYDKDIAAIRIDYSAGMEKVPVFLKRNMTAVYIFIDTGIGQLPKESPGMRIIARPDEEKQDDASQQEWWAIFDVQTTISLMRKYPAIGKIYMRKECHSSPLHSWAEVYSIPDVEEALEFFEKEAKESLDRQKVFHDENIKVIIEKRR